jgi:hypothetical protein
MAIYRAEVVGSPLRPAYLKQARLDLAADGPCSGTYLRCDDVQVMQASPGGWRGCGASSGSIGLKLVRTG